MMRSYLTGLVLSLNYLLDRGYYKFSVEAIKEKIRDRSLFNYLNQEISSNPHFDISLIDDDDKNWLLDQFELLDEFKSMADNIDEDRKLAVQKNGICLLLAYVIELIQRQRHN